MTFGSITPYQAQETQLLMRKAVKEAGCRAIIQADWNNDHSDFTTDSIYQCRSLPHTNIFPHGSAVVHHGGAGTTHTALRAGCPSVVVEHAFDQTFWGEELKRLGVAGEVLHRNSITVTQLADAIRITLNSQEMKTNAKALSEKMKTEDGDGVGTAIRLIEETFK